MNDTIEEKINDVRKENEKNLMIYKIKEIKNKLESNQNDNQRKKIRKKIKENAS